MGNHFVRLARDQPLEHLLLAFGKRLHPIANHRQARFAFTVLGVAGQRRSNGGEQNFIVERLFDEVDGARLHRFDREGNIAMPCHDDDRQACLQFSQAALELQPVHLGHANIGNDAASLDVGKDLQEIDGRGMHAHGEAGGAQQKGQGLAHGHVIVDHVNDPVSWHGILPPALQCAG